MTRVYCFTGYPASGKSTASSIAADAGLPVVVMGDVVRRRARADLGADATSEDIGVWATGHREQNGNDIFAHYTADAVEDADSETVIIDGLRTPTELAVFRERFTDVTAVFVEAPFETRLERIQSRSREDEGDYTASDLKARDDREADWGVADLLDGDHYDVVLDNDGAFDEFETSVLDLINTAA